MAIPAKIRAAVTERDGGLCRLCGATDVIAHHIRYGGDAIGMGGRRFHHVDNIVSLGQRYEHRCHQRAHANKLLWQPLLLEVVHRPGVTALQLYRWVALGATSDDLDLPTDVVARIVRDGQRAGRVVRARPLVAGDEVVRRRLAAAAARRRPSSGPGEPA